MTQDTQRFRVEVNVRVVQLTDSGNGQWYAAGGQGLEVRDAVDLTAAGFMEVAGILGRFHELAQSLKQESPL